MSRRAQPDDPGDVQRTGPQAPFVAPAVHLRTEPTESPSIAHEGSDPTGTTDLVAAQRNEVDTQLLHLQWHPPHELGGVRMEQGTGATNDSGDLIERVHHPRLGVGRDHRHQQNIWSEKRCQPPQIHESAGGDRDDVQAN